MNKQYYFLSGIPRSGSTVLATILSQNPAIFTTPTSPLLDLILETGVRWPQLSVNQKYHHPEQLKNICAGVFDSVYKHVDQQIILDKHRSWPRYVDLVKNVTGTTPKIIITTRDIPEVLASFITIIKKSGATYVDEQLRAANKPINETTRCRLLWEKYISVPWTSFKLGYENNRDCLHLVDYKEITESPETAIQGIYEFLQLKPYKHKFESLANPQPENDDAYGIKGLHDVRPILKRVSPRPEKILGERLTEYYSSLKLEFWKN